MGMPITVEVAAGTEAAQLRQIKRVFEHFRRVDNVFSTFRPDSAISRVNRSELVMADAPDEVQAVLAACERMSSDTDGYFNAYHDGVLDPSGYVKGWAIAGATTMLDEAGVARYLVEAGGDIQAKSPAAMNQPWRVGIRNPFHPDQVVKILQFHDGAVATSGSYVRGQHIYNPHTGEPASQLASMTVVGPDIIQADVYATAAYAMGRKGAEWVARKGLDAYQIDKEGQASFSDRIRAMSVQ